MSTENFSPRILGFLCNWCCYAAADAAGISRFQYPPNLRTIRVMCTGRMDPVFILRGLQEGADGIFTGGWQLGECHYQVGNYDAMAMKALTDRILSEIGIKPERFSLKWASAAEASRFVRLITDFTMEIKTLGPLGTAEGLSADELKERIEKGIRAVTDQKLRMSYGNAAKAVRKDAEWTMEHISGIINEKMEKTFQSIFHAPAK